MTWPAPDPARRMASPDGNCVALSCGRCIMDRTRGYWLHRRAPSIVDCVAGRPLAERVRASHRVETAAA